MSRARHGSSSVSPNISWKPTGTPNNDCVNRKPGPDTPPLLARHIGHRRPPVPLPRNLKMEKKPEHAIPSPESIHFKLKLNDGNEIDYDKEAVKDAVKRAMEIKKRRELFEDQMKIEGWEIEYSELTINEENEIGHGGLGDIYAAKWRGSTVAVKRLRDLRINDQYFHEFHKRTTLFCQLNHPNINRFFGVCLRRSVICMVMEFMQDSLYDRIHVTKYHFTPNDIKDILRGTSSGLTYLHSKDIAHFNIKSSNILVNIYSDNIVTKLTDYGLGSMKSNIVEAAFSKKYIEIPRYSAPEVLRGQQLTRKQKMKTDIYSFGLIVFEVFSEEEPYAQFDVSQLRTRVGERGMRPDIDKVTGMNPTLVYLVKNCWKESGNSRPTAKECRDVCA